MQPGFKLPSKPPGLTIDDKLLTIREAADFLNVHYQTIRNWMQRGEITFIKHGQTVRIPVSALARSPHHGETAAQPRRHDL